MDAAEKAYTQGPQGDAWRGNAWNNSTAGTLHTLATLEEYAGHALGHGEEVEAVTHLVADLVRLVGAERVAWALGRAVAPDNDDPPALAPGRLSAALDGMAWALRVAGDRLDDDRGREDYTAEEADALARDLAAARDLFGDLEAQA